MNPPTKGHEQLVNEMMNYEGDRVVYLSHSENNKRNPLSYSDKLEYATIAFGDVIRESTVRTVDAALVSLGESYKHLIMVVGADRVEEFQEMLDHYNESVFQFESYQVVSAGTRNPDADGVEGVSASALREACVTGNVAKITECLPDSLSDYAFDISVKVNEAFTVQEAIRINQKAKNKKSTDNAKSVLKSAISRVK